MRKWMGAICILLGAALVISALLLLGYNKMENEQAGESADAAFAEVQQLIAANRQEKHASATEAASKSENMPEAEGTQASDGTLKANDRNQKESVTSTVTDTAAQEAAADNYDYIGILSIPALELELPVMSEWSYARLKIAPCRQYGSAESDDLIIAAHNYKRHFGRLSKLKDGDSVTFTDLQGETYEYAVREIKVLEPTATEEVINSDWDLILYTCTYGGKTRVVVGCERLE